MAACQYRPHHRDGLRFIILNTNQHLLRLQDMREDLDPFKDLRRTVLHQTIVCGDIRLTLGSVDNQGVNFVAAAA